jgi:hypothetical protein
MKSYKIIDSNISSGLDDRVKQIANSMILTEDSGFDAVDFALLFTNPLFKFR